MQNLKNIANEAKLNNKLILKTTYFAMTVSIILSITKFLNYFITGSVAIQASALDSLLDIAVSFANFIAIKITQRKANELFPRGYDKIAALVALLQIILVGFLAFYLIEECIEKIYNPCEIHGFGYGIAIIAFALVLNTFLVLFQTKVVRQTGSLVIKADMLHYKTDFFTNLSIILGLTFAHFFNITWLDPVVGLISAIYLFFALGSLFKTTTFCLLDINDKKESRLIAEHLNKHDIKIEKKDVYILFTGTKKKVHLSIDKQMLNTVDLEEVKGLVQVLVKNSTIEFNIK